MKVLLINGSPHREGNTFIALSEVAKALEANGVEAEIVSMSCCRVTGVLRRAQRFALCLARPSVLFCRRLAGLQACCLGGCMPSRRSQCDVRPPEQVFHHQQHAGGVVTILEQRARQIAGRSESGHRGIADHAYAGAQHGVVAEELEAGRGAYPAQ